MLEALRRPSPWFRVRLLRLLKVQRLMNLAGGGAPVGADGRTLSQEGARLFYFEWVVFSVLCQYLFTDKQAANDQTIVYFNALGSLGPSLLIPLVLVANKCVPVG